MAVYRNGKHEIAVGKVDGAGKRPGLWIHDTTDKTSIKVATFSSEEKAELFEKYFREMFGMKKERR